MNVIIVPCTQEKIWDSHPDAGPTRAKDAYAKPVFQTWRTYAEQSGFPWYILSTKYGLMRPDQLVERYNVAVSTAIANSDFLRILARQGREAGLQTFDSVILLDWERFQPLVRAAVGDGATRCVVRRLAY